MLKKSTPKRDSPSQNWRNILQEKFICKIWFLIEITNSKNLANFDLFLSLQSQLQNYLVTNFFNSLKQVNFDLGESNWSF